ncbi:indole-3-acetate beta-glucosyltransferase-like [Zingiber officinale]|uniref:indole-3-acetate beta-glucosyltransferase-like n=1 Tax=Zingiber officinale TaxID=94328 RepID=UPI001C4C3FF0|nr:indole-3-acetate beta-glucosyltransferase-like [Zingiber officinale]
MQNLELAGSSGGWVELRSREIKKMAAAAAASVLVFPFPVQGHLNPMLLFAKRLAAKWPATTFLATRFIVQSIATQAGPVAVAAISDGYDAGGFASSPSLEVYLEVFEAHGARALSELMEARAAEGRPFTAVVYDTFVPWAAGVARRHGAAAVGFSTQSASVSAIYYYVRRGELAAPVEEGGRVAPPGMPEMERREFPTMALGDGAYATLAAYALEQFDGAGKDDWVLFNSFDELEGPVIECLNAHHFHAVNVGPCVPISAADGASYGVNLLPAEDDVCMRWLAGLPPHSAIYVSFGSFASLSPAQMTELALGLTACGRPFLWVVRDAERRTLPPGFSPALGLIVRWSPQLAVLAHPAVGCFVTHCGWNSTLESICLGVPMIGLPQWSDQPTNAKCVETEWKVGVRARPGDGGLVTQAELERCVRAVMDGDEGEEIRRSARRWSDLARSAIQERGSTDRNLDAFVEFVNSKTNAADSHQ